MRIFSWNVNGLPTTMQDVRSRYGCISTWFLEHLHADIVCFQEAKIQQEKLPKWLACVPGFQSFWAFSIAKKGYSGVVTYVRDGLNPVDASADCLESQCKSEDDICREGRVMATDHGSFVLLNVYAPNGGGRKDGRQRLGFKLAFMAALRRKCDEVVRNGKHLVLVGDLNISHRSIDVYYKWQIDEIYSPEELQWMNELLAKEYVDLFRHFHPSATGVFSVWDQKTDARTHNEGQRIDFTICDQGFLEDVTSAEIIKMSPKKWSDHAAVALCLREQPALPPHPPPALSSANMKQFQEDSKQRKLTSLFTPVQTRAVPPVSLLPPENLDHSHHVPAPAARHQPGPSVETSRAPLSGAAPSTSAPSPNFRTGVAAQYHSHLDRADGHLDRRDAFKADISGPQLAGMAGVPAVHSRSSAPSEEAWRPGQVYQVSLEEGPNIAGNKRKLIDIHAQSNLTLQDDTGASPCLSPGRHKSPKLSQQQLPACMPCPQFLLGTEGCGTVHPAGLETTNDSDADKRGGTLEPPQAPCSAAGVGGSEGDGGESRSLQGGSQCAEVEAMKDLADVGARGKGSRSQELEPRAAICSQAVGQESYEQQPQAEDLDMAALTKLEKADHCTGLLEKQHASSELESQQGVSTVGREEGASWPDAPGSLWAATLIGKKHVPSRDLGRTAKRGPLTRSRQKVQKATKGAKQLSLNSFYLGVGTEGNSKQLH